MAMMIVTIMAMIMTMVTMAIYHTFTRNYIHFACVILTWLSSTYRSCRAQKV